MFARNIIWLFALLISAQIILPGCYMLVQEVKIQNELQIARNRAWGLKQTVRFEFDTQAVKQIQWFDKWEFKLNGDYYDVLSRQVLSNGKLQVICHQDGREKQMYADLERYLDHKSKQDNQQTVQLISLTYVLPPIWHKITEKTILPSDQRKIFIDQDFKLASGYRSANDRPPCC